MAVSVYGLCLWTKNMGYIDRIWPIAPVLYAWAFLFTSFANTPALPDDPYYLMERIKLNESSSPLRLLIITVMITAWGARLAYAFYRRGFFSLDYEDHRWPAMRSALNYPTMKIPFHFVLPVFICFAGNYLLLGLTTPMWYLQNISVVKPFNFMDGFLVVLWTGSFVLEAVADEQQWNFQARKTKFLAFPATTKLQTEMTPTEIEDVKRGFIVRGLFAYVRHPNYLGELGMWWSIFLFTVSAQPWMSFLSFLNYSIMGAVGLTFLVQMTTPFTEKLQREKYAEYPAYACSVPRILPSCCSCPFEPPKAVSKEQ